MIVEGRVNGARALIEQDTRRYSLISERAEILRAGPIGVMGAIDERSGRVIEPQWQPLVATDHVTFKLLPA